MQKLWCVLCSLLLAVSGAPDIDPEVDMTPVSAQFSCGRRERPMDEGRSWQI